MKTLFPIAVVILVLVATSCNFSEKKGKKQSDEKCKSKSCCATDSAKVVKSEAIEFNSDLCEYIDSIKTSITNIDSLRKKDLNAFAVKVKASIDSINKADLVFICTHNSRRSHMSQLWAKVAADYHKIKNINCFSGGTEATAFNPRAVKALKKAGFTIEKTDSTQNPVYMVNYAKGGESIKAFSKKFDNEFNPTEKFLAVMTCSQADESCPTVLGATDRIAITYEDPKAFDNTPKEAAMYAERCYQIASEMFYVFSKVSEI